MASPGAAVPSPTAFDNSSAWMWSNFSLWTAQHLNITRYAPSFEDLLLAGPRMLTKLGSIIPFHDAGPGVDGGHATFGQQMYPDATVAANYFHGATETIQTVASSTLHEAVAAAASAAGAVMDEEMHQDPAAFASRFSAESTKGLGSIISYMTSKWALCCVAMAIVLNRTHIFAASRRRLRLHWPIRLLLRFIPIALFLYQAKDTLQSIQCQTSPDFAEMRWGNSTKSSDLMFAYPGGYLHTVSSTLLLGAADIDSCRAVNMVPKTESVYPAELQGSLPLLWPLFGTLCLSHFVETISCAVQGRAVAVETGMTLFEHSLAFAEADAAISNQLGWGLFGGTASSNVTFQQSSGPNLAISRSMIMRRVNTAPEVLFVAFLSSMGHVTSHLLGVFNLQSKFRLISTGFWALGFMASIVIEVYRFSFDDPASMGLFRFPTVCIIGFIPHVLVFAGIMMCSVIYALALTLSALAPPPGTEAAERLSFRQRLVNAHHNMQANISFSDIRISWEMDFYTALLRTGFSIITMASEAVYLNEDRGVTLKQHTWLEEQRFRELEKFRMQWTGPNMGDTPYDLGGAISLVPIKDNEIGASSGYARERAAQKLPKSKVGDKRARDGVGAAERSSRWLLALEFLMNIWRLVLRWMALIALKTLARIGITTQPGILVWLTRLPSTGKKDERQSGDVRTYARTSGRSGSSALRNDERVDIEAAVRQRLKMAPETANIPERDIDKHLYASWTFGELWGSADTSGDWEPAEDADNWDTTSMIYSVAGSEVDSGEDRDPWADDDDNLDDGQRTPTQTSPFASRESTPFDQPLPVHQLARLLHPQSPEDRQEAHTLAAHLSSDRIMTRSQYARQQASARTRLLTSSSGARRTNQKLTPDEEAELLEQLIISRRSQRSSSHEASQQPQLDQGTENTGSWAGLGDNGPQCVVCHSAPRTVIVWPCRCLSLCDECRVSLAMNNFDKCVCCRRDVVSFSRIYVP
ncbi:uncharacterized protein PG986_005223 [Apiospora aurea]|uniref:Uncharacterized protein n=1 Tax=Apiospora aurea TaxID=335848 RepID=A0ABR1QGX7_9PEZI